MTLAAGRNTKRRDGNKLTLPVQTAKTIYAGGMVTLSTTGGYAVPAGTSLAGAAVGVADETVVNAGAAGDKTVTVLRGSVFQFDNSLSTDLIARADIGNACYIVSDEKVAKTDNSASRAVAGIIVDVDATGVWVKVGT
ncbi:MAG: hypothetical protein ABI831_16370 [Betaproteobacteria bacterium]